MEDVLSLGLVFFQSMFGANDQTLCCFLAFSSGANHSSREEAGGLGFYFIALTQQLRPRVKRLIFPRGVGDVLDVLSLRMHLFVFPSPHLAHVTSRPAIFYPWPADRPGVRVRDELLPQPLCGGAEHHDHVP